MRLIARLDLKNNFLIKSVKYDGVRKIGDILNYSERYYHSSINELIISNITGSLYKTKIDCCLLKNIRKAVFMPIAAGGGILNLNDAIELIKSGCDKVIINSLIHTNSREAKKIINVLGSSSVIGAIQYSNIGGSRTYFNMGREKTGLCVEKTISLYKELGVGQILLTNIDKDGTYQGLDRDALSFLKSKDSMPYLIGGGFSSLDELKYFKDIFSAVVISSSLHYSKIDLDKLGNNNQFIIGKK